MIYMALVITTADYLRSSLSMHRGSADGWGVHIFFSLGREEDDYGTYLALVGNKYPSCYWTEEEKPLALHLGKVLIESFV